ncbi:MAG: glycosyl transferase family 2 [Bacteroidetes bacterium]|nr:glycosyl transferase family 2 [Bacteroidota bacterium]
MTKITALIITHNEEKHIGACLDSLTGVADEVIIVDSFSSDKTKEIAAHKGANVIEKEFAGFGAQKNMGAGMAANDYILSIDADEVLSEELRLSILKLKDTQIEGAWFVNRLNHIAGKPIKTCGWYPDIRTRLYNTKQAQWDNKDVHEELITADRITFLKGDLLHYSYEDYDDMKTRSDRYAKLGAASLKGSNAIMLAIKMTINPIAKFIKTYFLQMGFTDGYTGWMISRYKARETFYKYYLAFR